MSSKTLAKLKMLVVRAADPLLDVPTPVLREQEERRITRPSRSPIASASSYRRRYRHPGAQRVASLHTPLRTVSSALDKKQDKQARRNFIRDRLGLPRNTTPMIVRTLFPQYTLTRGQLMAACHRPRDDRFMTLFLDQGRLVPIDVWKKFTLMDALTYEHDHGLFIALDAMLITFFHNLLRDLIPLLAGGGRRRATKEDVNYIFNDVWPQRTRSRQLLGKVFSTFLQ